MHYHVALTTVPSASVPSYVDADLKVFCGSVKSEDIFRAAVHKLQRIGYRNMGYSDWRLVDYRRIG